ncbi:hypothetical protein Cni_G05556 [Canna indica]|uniref:BHLH domain-containing protein n=1 Tax=Canna indica TaxID=4628 RepID=A0AAQ3Q3V4_9LILI|nr:hypothetical protein Cni_G05556 [Canna indica]
MSSRRSRLRQSSNSSITDEQIALLVSKLQALLPENRASSSHTVSAEVLQDACDYIKSLHQEVDQLSERLARLLAMADMSNAQAELLRSLLMQLARRS